MCCNDDQYYFSRLLLSVRGDEPVKSSLAGETIIRAPNSHKTRNFNLGFQNVKEATLLMLTASFKSFSEYAVF